MHCIKLYSCDQITDASISASGLECGQVDKVNNGGCIKVTDVSVTTLDAGSGQLQRITLSCYMVIDASILALGHGCGQLLSIALFGCDRMTDACPPAVNSV